MSYLKTEDGRLYEIKSGCLKGTNILVDFLCNPREMMVLYRGDDSTIKQSENIEELCDVFVCFVDGKKHLCQILSGDDELKFYVEDDGDCKTFKFSDCEKVCGSIWVGEDLHAVAKMNEKKEWELI